MQNEESQTQKVSAFLDMKHPTEAHVLMAWSPMKHSWEVIGL
jgi:hypothetical protein